MLNAFGAVLRGLLIYLHNVFAYPVSLCCEPASSTEEQAVAETA